MMSTMRTWQVVYCKSALVWHKTGKSPKGEVHSPLGIPFLRRVKNENTKTFGCLMDGDIYGDRYVWLRW